MANSALKSSSSSTSQNDEHALTSRGVVVLRIIRQHVEKNLSQMLWIALGFTIFASVLADRAWILRPYYDQWQHPAEHCRRIAAVFSFFFYPRVADIHSRTASGMFALIFFLIGSVIVGITAARQAEPAYIFGIILHSSGSSGLSVLLKLTIADYTSLRWRALALSFIDFCNIPVVWVDVPMINNISLGWMYGMFGMILPAIFIPPIIALRSIALRHREEMPQVQSSAIHRILDGLVKLDLLGILIFTIGFGLIEFNMKILWTPYIPSQSGEIAMLVVGLILVVPLFTLWELCFSPFPLMPKWIFQKRGVICAVTAALFSHLANTFAQGVVPYQPLVGYRWARRPMPVKNLYEAIWLLGRGVFAPALGFIFLLSRRYKLSLMYGSSAFVGLCITGLVGAILYTTNDEINLLYLWVPFQILSAASTSAISLATTVGSQASVPHNDLSTLVGFTDSLMGLGSILGSQPWHTLMHSPIPVILFALAIVFAVLCVVPSHFMPAYILGDEHNVIEGKDAALDNTETTGDALVATGEVTGAAISYFLAE